MIYPVSYEVEVLYTLLPGIPGMRPWLDITLHRGNRETGAAGLLDSGSTHTVFSQQYAGLLGIDDITTGVGLPISTAGGSIRAYLFDDVEIEIRVGGVNNRFSGNIAFAEGHLSRNILGLNHIFNQFRIGFRDSQQRFYLLKDTPASILAR